MFIILDGHTMKLTNTFAGKKNVLTKRNISQKYCFFLIVVHFPRCYVNSNVMIFKYRPIKHKGLMGRFNIDEANKSVHTVPLRVEISFYDCHFLRYPRVCQRRATEPHRFHRSVLLEQFRKFLYGDVMRHVTDENGPSVMLLNDVLIF